MAAFLVLWGTLAVSSVDNFIKPLLIARGTSMPIALIFSRRIRRRARLRLPRPHPRAAFACRRHCALLGLA